MSNIFSGYSIQLGYATAQVLNLNQIDSLETEVAAQHTPVVPAGAIVPTAYVVPKVRPTGRFTTMDLATFFTAVDVSTGLLCNEESKFAVAARAQGGGGLLAATATSHQVWTAQLGQVYPESITATADSESGATVSANFIALTNGSVAPFVFAGSQAINDLTAPGYNSVFFLASPYHNGVEIPGVRSINLDFGPEYRTAANTPDTYDDCVVKVRQVPEFRFTVAKADEFATQSVVGEAVNTSFAFYLQRADAAGSRVSAASSSHFKLSFTSGKIVRNNIQFDGSSEALVEFVVRPVGALSVSLASAIGA